MEIHHISILLVINVILYGKHISNPNVNLRAIGRWFGTNDKTITCDDVPASDSKYSAKSNQLYNSNSCGYKARWSSRVSNVVYKKTLTDSTMIYTCMNNSTLYWNGQIFY